MPKYVRLSGDRKEMTSAIFTQKPNNMRRHDDASLPRFGWFPVEEHKPALPDSDLYTHTRASWELAGDIVHIYYDIILVNIDKRKEILIDRCNVIRDERLMGGLFFAGLEFDTRRTTLLRVLGRWTSAVLDSSIDSYWITEDNKTVYLSNENLIKFGRSFELFEESIVMHSRGLKDQIDESDSPEMIDITTGWPSNSFYSDVVISEV